MATTDIRNERGDQRTNNALWAILALVVLALAVFAWFSYGDMSDEYITTSPTAVDTTGTEGTMMNNENMGPATDSDNY